MKCPDCNGSGVYTSGSLKGFTCELCDGGGEVHPSQLNQGSTKTGKKMAKKAKKKSAGIKKARGTGKRHGPKRAGAGLGRKPHREARASKLFAGAKYTTRSMKIAKKRVAKGKKLYPKEIAKIRKQLARMGHSSGLKRGRKKSLRSSLSKRSSTASQRAHGFEMETYKNKAGNYVDRAVPIKRKRDSKGHFLKG